MHPKDMVRTVRIPEIRAAPVALRPARQRSAATRIGALGANTQRSEQNLAEDPAQAVEETAQIEDQEQVHGDHGPERFYIYEYDADQDQAMEQQYEDCGIEGAAESFLLPELRSTIPYPDRCRSIGPMCGDLVDPKGQLKPSLTILHRLHRSGLVGMEVQDGRVRAKPTATSKYHGVSAPGVDRTD